MVGALQFRLDRVLRRFRSNGHNEQNPSLRRIGAIYGRRT